MDIAFGAFAPPLSEQLDGWGLSESQLTYLQKDADAIVRLSVRGLLSAREKQSALRRLVKKAG